MTSQASQTLIHLLNAGRPNDGTRLFARTPDSALWTYDDLGSHVDRLSAAVRSAGVVKSDRVAVQVEKSLFAVALHIALIRVGAVQLPLNTAYTEAEVAALLADAEPALVIRDPKLIPVDGPWTTCTFDEQGEGTLLAARQSLADVVDATVDPEDPAAMLYTSGTTGRPKAAVLSHANLTQNAHAVVAAWEFTADDHLLHVLPLFHTHGLFVALHAVLASGASMTLVPAFDPAVVIAGLPRASVLMGVPTHYSRLLEQPGFESASTSHVRLFTSGSAPMPLALHQRLHERLGSYVLERYGMTETSMLTTNPLHGERKPGTVGRPFPGVSVRVVDDVDRSVQAETVGEVQVTGANVFDGYWRRPELQETEFTTDGWFRTGDVGRFDEDGYLVLVGRSKDLIITGGLNVYPVEVESVLDALDGVKESAVVGLSDDDFGESVTAVIVLEGGATFDETGMRVACRERLAGFKVPKRIVTIDELPRNAMGKVAKKELRATLTARTSLDET